MYSFIDYQTGDTFYIGGKESGYYTIPSCTRYSDGYFIAPDYTIYVDSFNYTVLDDICQVEYSPKYIFEYKLEQKEDSIFINYHDPRAGNRSVLYLHLNQEFYSVWQDIPSGYVNLSYPSSNETKARYMGLVSLELDGQVKKYWLFFIYTSLSDVLKGKFSAAYIDTELYLPMLVANYNLYKCTTYSNCKKSTSNLRILSGWK